MGGSSLLMLVVGLAAIAAGGFVLTRKAESEVAIYLRRIGGIMLIAFGAFLMIAAVSLGSALGGAKA